MIRGWNINCKGSYIKYGYPYLLYNHRMWFILKSMGKPDYITTLSNRVVVSSKSVMKC